MLAAGVVEKIALESCCLKQHGPWDFVGLLLLLHSSPPVPSWALW